MKDINEYTEILKGRIETEKEKSVIRKKRAISLAITLTALMLITVLSTLAVMKIGGLSKAVNDNAAADGDIPHIEGADQLDKDRQSGGKSVTDTKTGDPTPPDSSDEKSDGDGATIPQEQEMIMVDGNLYVKSCQNAVNVTEDDIIGYTLFVTSGKPTVNGATNVSVKVGTPYAKVGQNVAILIDGEWTVFVMKEVKED